MHLSKLWETRALFHKQYDYTYAVPELTRPGSALHWHLQFQILPTETNSPTILVFKTSKYGYILT